MRRNALELPDLGDDLPPHDYEHTLTVILVSGQGFARRQRDLDAQAAQLFQRGRVQSWEEGNVAADVCDGGERWIPLHPGQPDGVQPPTATSRESLTKVTMGQ